MALHTTLPIYRATHDLSILSINLARNFPRDVKKLVGGRVLDGCTNLAMLIREANIAKDKTQYLDAILGQQSKLEYLFRLCQDMRFISKGQYAKAIALTSSVGRQANGWKAAS